MLILQNKIQNNAPNFSNPHMQLFGIAAAFQV